jgi:hypothetical protein
MTQSLRDEVLDGLEKLPERNVRLLLEALRRTPDPGYRNWSPAIGLMSDEEVDEMMAIIEGGCERADPVEWWVRARHHGCLCCAKGE